MTLSPKQWTLAVVIGLFAGILSGLFGVGGGIIIVPALVLLLAIPQRLASGTSLAATVPIGIVGIITYAAHSSLDLYTGVCLAVGASVGALGGAWLLQRMSPRWIQLIFAAVMITTAVKLFTDLPDPQGTLPVTVGHTVALVAFGLVVGVLAGLLGIGGGLVIVPVLMLFFGIGSTFAKGASLVSIVPTGISGTWANLRNGNVSITLAAAIGIPGAISTVLGGTLVQVMDVNLATVLFAILLVFSACQLALKALRSGPRHR